MYIDKHGAQLSDTSILYLSFRWDMAISTNMLRNAKLIIARSVCVDDHDEEESQLRSPTHTNTHTNKHGCFQDHTRNSRRVKHDVVHRARGARFVHIVSSLPQTQRDMP